MFTFRLDIYPSEIAAKNIDAHFVHYVSLENVPNVGGTVDLTQEHVDELDSNNKMLLSRIAGLDDPTGAYVVVGVHDLRIEYPRHLAYSYVLSIVPQHK